MNHAVTIIIPIYKVEKYIEQCAVSLFEQTLECIEYVFVDDCSPDQSIAVLEGVLLRYSHRKQDVKVVRHASNRGLPCARNSGLAIASGEYIFHCDSDDWLEKDAIEKMYLKAQQQQADIVWCDWFLSFKDNERYMSERGQEEPMACLIAMLSGSMKFNVWNKLVKRSLYCNNEIRFPDGYGMGEDMTMIKLFVFGRKIAYIPAALYHYVQLNANAYTKNRSENSLLQIEHNANDLFKFIDMHHGDKLRREVLFFKLNIKLPFLISNRISSYKKWLDWYPEANGHIWQNKMLPVRTRLIQYAALHRQFWILKLYYYLVIKVVYGAIYR